MYDQYQSQSNSFLIALVMRLGAKDAKQAQQVLVGIAIVLFCVSGWLIYRVQRPPQSTVTQEQIDAVFKGRPRL